MSRSRRAPGIVGAIILTVAVAACSGQASPSPSAAPSVTAAPAASEAAATPSAVPTLAPATVSFAWIAYEQDNSTVEAAVKAFEDANPGVDVEMSYYSYEDYSKAIPAALAAGNPPDLAFGDPTAPNTPNFVKAGQLDPLQPLIDKYGWEDRLQPGVITFYNPLYGGETYGIPLFAAQRGIFYNKDILEKVGGTVPTTLDELEALLAKVKAAGYTPLFMGSADKYGVDYYWLGLALDYLSAGDWKAFTEGTMTWKPGTPWGGEEVRKGTERLLKWRDAGYFNDDYAALPADDLSKGFVDGTIFAVANGTNLNASIKAANPAFEVGFMNWPALDASSTEHLYISDPGQILILPKDSKHKDHADRPDGLDAQPRGRADVRQRRPHPAPQDRLQPGDRAAGVRRRAARGRQEPDAGRLAELHGPLRVPRPPGQRDAEAARRPDDDSTSSCPSCRRRSTRRSPTPSSPREPGRSLAAIGPAPHRRE